VGPRVVLEAVMKPININCECSLWLFMKFDEISSGYHIPDDGQDGPRNATSIQTPNAAVNPR